MKNRPKKINSIMLHQLNSAEVQQDRGKVTIETTRASIAKEIGFKVIDHYAYTLGAVFRLPAICRQVTSQIIEAKDSRKKMYLFVDSWNDFKRALDRYQVEIIEENFIIKDFDYLHSEHAREQDELNMGAVQFQLKKLSTVISRLLSHKRF